MKLPEDRELCVIDLDWKKQSAPELLLSAPSRRQTKKKSMEMKMTIRLTSFLACKCQCRRSRRSIGADDIPRSGERPRPSALAQRRFVLSSSRCDFRGVVSCCQVA
ncbi:hypothetical protein Pcac1_g29548 [Phytophthora cactorum]|nr:hypothetical protein Pcac1_g29548 [Phytophthora cactorum]